MSCKGQVQQIKAWVKNQRILSEDQNKGGPRKRQQPSACSSSLHKHESTTKSAKQGQSSPKEQSEGKGKVQVEKALPAELQNSKERKDSNGQCVQYGQNSDGIKKQGGEKNEPILSKKIDLVKLATHLETCNKQILANFNNFEYTQHKLGREILQVKETQNTIIGHEIVNKGNILPLMHIFERIESKVTLLI
ncbi:hypothetical protein O181_062278 [Austropuccinia psidii MF-1]|uniref:Uncharacterized protein n=1 Tax=Austropuccinia psidii MF-1 TaxID=1389203 RepID=A0A9Q3HZD3_9BASI|nr:hypothetical protein [Austropuccinia psidii MF-1]